MRDVRNSDGRLVCRVDNEGSILIYSRGCLTRIERLKDGKIKIVNTKKTA